MGRPPHGKHPAHNFRPGKNVGTAILLCVLVGGSVVTVVVVDIVIKTVLFSSTVVGLSQEKRTDSKRADSMPSAKRTPVGIAEKVVAANPDVWVLHADLLTITVENKKTHEITTVSQEDALKGNISFTPPPSNNLWRRAPNICPNWIPDYPGTEAQWVNSVAWETGYYSKSPKGSYTENYDVFQSVTSYTGEFSFVTTDSFDQIAANYRNAFKEYSDCNFVAHEGFNKEAELKVTTGEGGCGTFSWTRGAGPDRYLAAENHYQTCWVCIGITPQANGESLVTVRFKSQGDDTHTGCRARIKK